MPLTLSVSSVMEVRSARVFCVFIATSRRARPTFTVSHTNRGVMNKESTVSCQEMINMAMSELMITTTLERSEDAVLVTTLCTPPTSFARRDWISPVRVEVKNRSGMYWRCR